jgi:hypothetical protein
MTLHLQGSNLANDFEITEKKRERGQKGVNKYVTSFVCDPKNFVTSEKFKIFKNEKYFCKVKKVVSLLPSLRHLIEQGFQTQRYSRDSRAVQSLKQVSEGHIIVKILH